MSVRPYKGACKFLLFFGGHHVSYRAHCGMSVHLRGVGALAWYVVLYAKERVLCGMYRVPARPQVAVALSYSVTLT